MELQQLEYFKKAAELEHITKAANELMLAQPALSKTIKTLEEELGAPLFDREKKRIRLNGNGRILLRCAGEVENCLAQIRRDLEQNQEKENKQITLLLKATPILLPKLIQAFSKEYPDISFQMLTYNSSVDETKLRYDFIVNSSTRPSQDSNALNFFQEEMVLAVPSQHPLAGRMVSLAEAKGENFISLPSQYSLHHEFLQCCREAGFQPHIVLESSDHFTILGMIEAEMGIALVPSISWGFQNMPGIAFVKVKEPACRNIVFLSWNTKHSLSKSCQRFLEFISDFANHPEDILRPFGRP